MSRRDPAKEQHWRETIKAHGASDMTVRAFCRERGISEYSFHSWKRKLRAAEACPGPAFTEVRMGAAENASLVLELPGSITARLPLDVSGDVLTNVLTAVHRAGQC